MNILFIHQNFPGQYKHLARYFAEDEANTVVAICQGYAPITQAPPSNIKALIYKPSRSITKGIHGYVSLIESAVLNGQEVARKFVALKKNGFTPDICFAHGGWGESLFFKDIFPNTPLVAYCEFFYHTTGIDINFDPEFPSGLDSLLKTRMKNMVPLLTLENCDTAISPTKWQKQLFPKEYLPKISVIHEGIDASIVKPDPNSTFILPDGTVLDRSMEIITYTSRNLEPYRGFHIFMRALEIICQRRPNCHVLITGGDSVSYGSKLPNGQNYREKMLAEVDIDLNRVHFLGKIPYDRHINMLQVSLIHIYLTVPFVLSWSMLEAMSAGCLILGSDTTPVKELIKDGDNGLLFDYFSPQQIADQVDKVFSDPDKVAHIRTNARNFIIKHYNVKDSLKQYTKIYKQYTQTT